MTNGTKRFLAALLCVLLCVSVLPVPAAAEAGMISAAGDGTIEKAAESGSITEAAVSGEDEEIAGGQDPENGAVLREEVYINPLYADVISEEDLVRPKRDAKSRASGEVYSTEEEAGVYVREHMRNREETIVVLVAYSVYQDNPSGFLRGIKRVAMAHTGDPTEGDYILWQYAGWNSIIYMAAMSNFDPSLYEAATVDGANRFQCIRNITLPLLKPTVIVLCLMSIGRIFYGDFGMIYGIVGNNSLLYDEVAVIDTYVYSAMKSLGFSYTTAIGLMQSVLGLILVTLSNHFAKKVNEGEGLF